MTINVTFITMVKMMSMRTVQDDVTDAGVWLRGYQGTTEFMVKVLSMKWERKYQRRW